MAPLQVYYSESFWDNAVVATQTAAYALRAQGYQDVTARFPIGLDSYVAVAPFEGSVPLTSYIRTDGHHRDSMAVASLAGVDEAKAKHYTRSSVVGYVWADGERCATDLGDRANCVALNTWVCTRPSGEQDHIVATDAWSTADTLAQSNYTRVRTEGYAAVAWPLPARPLPLPAALMTSTLLLFWSERYKDSLTVSAAMGQDYAKGLIDEGYVQQGKDQGRVFTTQWSADLLPLRLFFNAVTHHHLLAASEAATTWAGVNGYVAVPNGTQGWVWPWEVSSAMPVEGSRLIRDGTAPLQHFYSSRSGDVMLVGERSTMQTARADGEGTCSRSWHNSSCGYSFQRIDALYPTQRWYEWPRAADAQNGSTLDGVPSGCPLKRSTLFNRILFSDRVSNYAMTAADTWYPSWGADDLLYSIFTDGEVGFYARGEELIRDQLPMNKTNNDRELNMPSSIFCCSSCRQSEANTGSAILQGRDPLSMTVQALGCSPASHGHFDGRYPSANLHYNGTWYVMISWRHCHVASVY
jgi:hypothetical protein